MKVPLWRSHQQEDLNAELQSHLQMAIQDRIARGETPEQAGAFARSEFPGGPHFPSFGKCGSGEHKCSGIPDPTIGNEKQLWAIRRQIVVWRKRPTRPETSPSGVPKSTTDL